MAALTWSWQDYWNWFIQIENDEDKKIAIQTLIGGRWMANLSPQSQATVMRYAPMEVLVAMKHFPDIFKREAILIIQRELDKENKVPKRRFRF